MADELDRSPKRSAMIEDRAADCPRSLFFSCFFRIILLKFFSSISSAIHLSSSFATFILPLTAFRVDYITFYSREIKVNVFFLYLSSLNGFNSLFVYFTPVKRLNGPFNNFCHDLYENYYYV